MLVKLDRNYMGFSFNFFGTQEVRKFSYKPRFYDPEAEERRKKYGDFTKPKDEKYVGPNLLGRLLMELRDNGKLEYSLPDDAFDFISELPKRCHES